MKNEIAPASIKRVRASAIFHVVSRYCLRMLSIIEKMVRGHYGNAAPHSACEHAFPPTRHHH